VNKTTIVGYLIVAVAVINTVIDVLNGGGFELSFHVNDLLTGLAGLGFVFGRAAIAKIR